MSVADTTSIQSSPVECYHCGLSIDKPQEFTAVVNRQERQFCCPSCQAVAMMIQQGGLDQFYEYRSQLNRRPDQTQTQEQFALYDRDDVQASFVVHETVDSQSVNSASQDQARSPRTAYLLLDDITCAACVWLIEQRLRSVTGVLNVRVNASTHECTISWDAQMTPLSAVMAALSDIGYRPQPLTRDKQQQHRQKQQRIALMRLAVAAFGMMQVGMVSIGLHAGDIQGMEEQWLSYFRWISLLVATPVVLFSAQPFWSVAWRNLLRGHLTMEVPVSLAIVLAYVASAWATVTGTGEVYFDSVSMFTFFLLLGRYLEMRTRFNNHQKTSMTAQLLPLVARKIHQGNGLPANANEDAGSLVVLAELMVGDVVQIRAGETVPCDGEVIEGHTAIIESILTGESEPVEKQVGDDVIAGTVNTDGTVLIRVTASERDTRLSTIEKLTRFAEQDKPKIQELANKVARYFVGAVLIVASAVFTFWWFYDPSQAFWVMLSVLVVTCPCALSLATPTVLTATTAALRGSGLLVLKGHVIETLTKVTQVVFDKTGTLTEGHPKVVEVLVLDPSIDQQTVLAIAAALEDGASHPIANAFAAYKYRYPVLEREIVTGAGVRGVVNVNDEPQLYSLGKPSFSLDGSTAETVDIPSAGQWLLLSREQRPMAWIRLSDPLRASSVPAIQQLQQSLSVHILSGDHPSVVRAMAHDLGVSSFQGGVLPEQKLAYIQEQQDPQQAQTLLMVGDGINDVPVLAGADVSIAMGSASDFARTHADAILLNSDLQVLPKAVLLAHRCRKIMRQNITFSLAYNVTALPLAAAGFIPPYIAAIGMSLSSLVVVINALRVNR